MPSREFPLGAVVRLARIHRRTLDTSAKTGSLAPSIRKAAGTGNRRAYSFFDIVEAHGAGCCRQRDLTFEGLSRVVAHLQRTRELKDPRPDARLIVQGKSLAIARGEAELLVAFRQACAHEAIDIGRTATEIRRGIEGAE